jgi:ABC-type dipeptide/oligopeptide/nickel transport system permease subunit
LDLIVVFTSFIGDLLGYLLDRTGDTFMSKKTKTPRPDGTLGIIIGAGMMAALLLAGLLIPWLGKYDPDEISSDQLLSPSSTHYFGTDMLGRDVFNTCL